MVKPKVIFVVGTRPDAIKSAPAVREFLRFPELVETILVSTGQHREMLAQALAAFDLTADFDLNIMQAGQSLAQVTTRALEGLDKVFAGVQPQWVFAQGDTTTTFVAGLASFYRQIPFGHIEAGLRTDSIWNPFPEEFNRRAVGLFAAQHYAPTSVSAQNLLNEGISEDSVFVTGNTGIDAVMEIAKKSTTNWYPEETRRLILLTTHRRENWGEPMADIASAARELLDQFPDTFLVAAMHRNPVVRETLTSILGNHERAHLIEPPDYQDFVKLMARSYLILTDSGGVQEEAPSFGIPVLVLRTTTERPEGVDAGVAKLVGTDRNVVFAEASKLLADEKAYNLMAQSASPYGDGQAAQRIRFLALKALGVASPQPTSWT